jgi:hypothetical protein
MKDRGSTVTSLLAVALLCAAVSCSSKPTDTVFSGRWERGRDTFSHSIISIRNEGGTFIFRVDRYLEGEHTLRCPREGGPCTIYDGDAPVYELTFETRLDEGDNALLVECEGKPLDGKSTPVQWVERVTVAPDGSELLVQRIELNHQQRTDGPRHFAKLSDDPF